MHLASKFPNSRSLNLLQSYNICEGFSKAKLQYLQNGSLDLLILHKNSLKGPVSVRHHSVQPHDKIDNFKTNRSFNHLTSYTTNHISM